MRRAAAVDANQPAIVGALRAYGYSVQHLHGVGGGCPDILVGLHGKNCLMEIKDGDKPPSARALTGPELAWHGAWRGQVAVVSNVSEALKVAMEVLG